MACENIGTRNKAPANVRFSLVPKADLDGFRYF